MEAATVTHPESKPPVEVEAKFLVQNLSQVPGVLQYLTAEGYTVRNESTRDIVDRYYDTHDWRLFREGWSYRWQNRAGSLRLCLKGLGNSHTSLKERREVEEDVVTFPSSPLDLADGELSQVLSPLLGDAQPQELFRVHKNRRLYLINRGNQLRFELCIDETVITCGEKQKSSAPGTLKFEEIELELRDGDRDQFNQLAEDLRSLQGLFPARLSKFQRGLQTGGYSPPCTESIREVFLPGPDEDISRLAYYVLHKQLIEMLHHEGEAWEGLEPEGVHQMRVATRRIRAGLRLFQDSLPSNRIDSLIRDFRWLADLLGEVRDLDVYFENYEKYQAMLNQEDGAELSPFRDVLQQQWNRARKKLIAGLESKRYARLVERFKGFAEKQANRAGNRQERDSRIISKAGPNLASRRLKRVLKIGRSVASDSPLELLHELRINCKKLRYAYEFFEPVFGAKVKKLIVPLKNLQDILGNHQDAIVAGEKLREYAELIPVRKKNLGLLLALGQLVSNKQQVAEKLRKDFAKAWRKFDTKALRKRHRRVFG